MTSKALQIRNAVVALLTASAIASVVDSSDVYTDWPFHIKTDDVPAVAVELGDEPDIQRFVIGALDRKLQIKISILSKGSSTVDAATAADPIVVEVHRRIVADLTLGGLAMDVIQDSVARRRDTLEGPVLITELNYVVLYRTSNTSLES